MLRKTLLGIIIFNSLAVYGVWAAEFLGGVASPDIFAASQEQRLLFLHILAAGLAAVALAGSAWALTARKGWAPELGLLGLGALTYAVLNEAGWALQRGVWPLVPMLGMAATVAWVGPRMLRRTLAGPARAQRGELAALWALAACALLDAALVYEPWAHGVVVAAPVPGVIATHLAGELMMATIPLVSAIALLRGSRNGHGWLVFGLGAGAFAALCAADWAIVNQPEILAPMGFAVAITAVTVPVLTRARAGRLAEGGSAEWHARAA